jgi:predicted PurR-regulated permease PerM
MRTLCEFRYIPMLDTIATVFLAGMMFVPLINLFVGIIVGAGLFGFWGAIAGAAIAILITIAQTKVKDFRSVRPAREELSVKIPAFPGELA